MKKIIFAAALLLGSSLFADTQYLSYITDDVYNFSASLSVPYVNRGVRNYRTCSFKGTLTLTYFNESTITRAALVITNQTSKAEHIIDLSNECVYRFMGPSKKLNSKFNIITEHTKPSIYLSGNTDECSPTSAKISSVYETFVQLCLSGAGSNVTYIKDQSCTSCSNPQIWYDIKTKYFSGTLTGLMDTGLDPDEQDMTVVMGADGEADPSFGWNFTSDTAAVYGNWTARFNEKSSKVFYTTIDLFE